MQTARGISILGKRRGLPWNGIAGIILLASFLLNIVVLTMNAHQHLLIADLSPAFTLYDMRLDFVRRLSGTTNGASAPNTNIGNTSHATSGNASHISTGSASGCGDAHHGGHKHDALLYLFNAFCVGALVMQVSSRYPILQQSVMLFMLGFVFSLIVKGLNLTEELGVLGGSYEMWVGIDPHLALFTLLPALLAGDAMTIDTSVAKRVYMQCLWLAGPGVLICAFATAAFLMFYLDWSFQLSLCAGSILCATDPVAVVALLKELGASPILTIQIQGESLINDGTAIVLFLISYNMMCGKEYDVPELCEFLVKKAMVAWALGLFIGFFFFSWIRGAADKLSHSSSMIQITLTLCCAYWSYIFVEGVLGLSGVLGTVASSLVLADTMWPFIVCTESLHQVWHCFESLGNIIIFFLAGSITGVVALDIAPINYLHLLVIYVFLVLLRGALIFASRPLLTSLSADKMEVRWQDACLMTWGGLRGAVGLALAIQVNNDRAPHIETLEPQVGKEDAQRLLFYVSGVAFLTIGINASTSPWLVNRLSLTALPWARKTLLKMFHQQLVNWSVAHEVPPQVTESLIHMLKEADQGIQSFHSDSGVIPFRASHVHVADCQSNQSLIEAWKEQHELYVSTPQATNYFLGEDFDDKVDEDGKVTVAHLLGNTSDGKGKVDDMVKLLGETLVNENMAKAVNQVFLKILQHNYWKLIEAGSLRPGSPESEVLITSVQLSLSNHHADLSDYQFVNQKLTVDADFSDEDPDNDADGLLSDHSYAGHAKTGCSGRIASSWQFNVGIVVAIGLNSIQVVVEEIWRDPDNAELDGHIGWMLLDGLFILIFFLEFVVKICWLKCSYFGDWWNRFDCFLVWVGLIGLLASVYTHGQEEQLAGETRIVRVGRVLRTLRFLRIFKLFHARMSADKFVSMSLARHVKKASTLACFIRAHVRSQMDLVKYFGGNGVIDEVEEAELARCVIQSQVVTYMALREAASSQTALGDKVCSELQVLLSRRKIAQGLSEFVLTAHRDGAISATEAHAILHPMNQLIADCIQKLNDRTEGVLDCPHQLQNSEKAMAESRQSKIPVLKHTTSTASSASKSPPKEINFHSLGVVPDS